MILDPEELIAQAEALQATGTTVGSRTGMNRAYYAVHLSARDLLYGPDAVRWTGNSRRPSHVAVLNAVRNHHVFSPLAQPLDELKKMREAADYVRDDDHPEVQALFLLHGVSGWQGLADIALALARDITTALQQPFPAN